MDTRWRHLLESARSPEAAEEDARQEEKVDMIFTSKRDLTGTGQVTQTFYWHLSTDSGQTRQLSGFAASALAASRASLPGPISGARRRAVPSAVSRPWAESGGAWPLFDSHGSRLATAPQQPRFSSAVAADSCHQRVCEWHQPVRDARTRVRRSDRLRINHP